MKKIYILIITLCGAIAANAQSYYQVGLPGTEATAIIQNPAGNLIVAGYTFVSGTNADVLLYEIDTVSGSVVRSKQFSTNAFAMPHSMCNTFDGNYLVTGYVSATQTDNDLFVAKLDTGFNIIWCRQMGLTGSNSNDYGNSIEVMDSGLYAITGTVSIGGSAAPSIIYLNDSGNVVKEFHLNTNQFASPNYKAKLLSDGTFGFINLTNDLCIVDTSGNILKNDPANFGIYTTDMLRNSNGDYAILAYADYGSPQGGTTALCVYDSSITNLLLNIKISTSSFDLVPKQLLMDNGSFLISANAVDLNTGNSNGVLIKIDSTGNLIWAKTFTPTGVAGSFINSLMIASDGSYVVAGNEGAYPNTVYYIVKMDSSGNVCESLDLATTVSTATKSTVTTHSLNVGTTPLISTIIPTATVATGTTIALCSGTTGVYENKDYHSNLYPNPSNDKLHIETIFNEVMYVYICSIDGKIISTQKLDQQGDINIHSLSSGIYMIRINDVSGKIISQYKFIKY